MSKYATSLKEKTESLRCKIVYGVARLITPKVYVEIKDAHEFIQRTPRPFTLFLQKQFGKTPLTGVEIGFGLGHNAHNLLETLNIRKLFCVDPCIGQPYQDLHGEVRCHVNKRSYYPLLKEDSRVEFIEQTSDDALRVLPKELDFVYIDGLHTYEQCLKDLKNYAPFVRKGGVLGGHDFTKYCQEGVIKAVLHYTMLSEKLPTVEMPDFWFLM